VASVQWRTQVTVIRKAYPHPGGKITEMSFTRSYAFTHSFKHGHEEPDID